MMKLRIRYNIWKAQRLSKKIDKEIFEIELLLLTLSIKRNLSATEMAQEIKFPGLLNKLYRVKSVLNNNIIGQKFILRF